MSEASGYGGTFPPPDLPLGRAVELPGRGMSFVRDTGPADGTPVVLLHGWTANAATNWFGVYGPLAETHRVIGVDQRGHGGGVRSSQRFRLEDCADDVAALLDVLRIDRAVMVGYSMGGPVAQLTWRRHRDRVDGLVLCATSRHFRSRGAGDVAFQGVLFGLATAARAAPDRVWRNVAERVLLGRYDSSPLGRWASTEYVRNDQRMVIEAGHAIRQFSSRDWIGGVDVPTAVVITENDHVVPPHRQRRLAESIPGASMHPVAGRHDVCALHPERFSAVLRNAVDDVSRRAAARARNAS